MASSRYPLFGPESDPNYAGPPRPRDAGEDMESRSDVPFHNDLPEPEPSGDIGPLGGSAELNQRHREIIRLAFLGRTNTEIAERMDMDRGSVGLILRSPLAQAELARLNSKAEAILVNTPLRVALDEDLRAAATESLRINRAILNDPSVDVRVRSKTAQHFMDRVIFQENPDEKESSYRDILRRLDAIDRNVRLNGTGITLFPSGAVAQALNVPDERPSGAHSDEAKPKSHHNDTKEPNDAERTEPAAE